MVKKLILLILAVVLSLILFITLKPSKLPDKQTKQLPKQTVLNPQTETNQPIEAKHYEPENDSRKYVAIIMDDIGYNREIVDEVLALPFIINLAFIPHLSYNSYLLEKARNHKGDILMHLPMQARSYYNEAKYKGGIYLNQSDSEIEKRVLGDIKAVPYCVGVNNHTGSVGTADRRVMSAVLKVVKQQGLYFIDSFTSGKSMGYTVAKEMGIPAAKRLLFFDIGVNLEYDRIRENIRSILRKKSKNIIAICHPHESTVKALADEIPYLEKQGIKFVSVTVLLEREHQFMAIK